MSPYFEKSPSEVGENNHKIKVHALNKLYNYVLTEKLLWKFIYRNKCIDISLNQAFSL